MQEYYRRLGDVLASRFSQKHRERVELEALAEMVRSELARGEGLPVDVEALASAMGFRVRVADLPTDGRIIGGREPSIETSARNHHARRRFTIAHEIAHVVLWAQTGPLRGIAARYVAAAQRTSVTPADERRCDRLAAALLLPRGRVEERAREGVSLRVVEDLAAEAATSFEATLTRVLETHWWRGAWALWVERRAGRRLVATRSVPWKDEYELAHVVIDARCEALVAAATESSAVTRGIGGVRGFDSEVASWSCDARSLDRGRAVILFAKLQKPGTTLDASG